MRIDYIINKIISDVSLACIKFDNNIVKVSKKRKK